MFSPLRLLSLSAAVAATLSTSVAFAQDATATPPAGQVVQPAQQAVYVAPLSQTTQTTYVPQSVAMSGPEEISDFEEGQVVQGYTPVKRTRKGAIITGSILFGVTYGLSALIAAAGEDLSSNGHNEVAALWIPGVGPFVQMANTKSATADVFLVGLGAAQTVGLGLLIYGVTSPKTVLVRNDLVAAKVQFAPIVAKGVTGVGLSGSF